MKSSKTVMNFAAVLPLLSACSMPSGVLAADNVTAAQREAESARIVSQYGTRFTTPPRVVGKFGATDAPLLGNGEMGVCNSGPPERQMFWLDKNDFWHLKSGNGTTWAVLWGRLNISTPALKGATYDIKQSLYTAQTTARFTKGDLAVKMVSWVAAEANALVIGLSAEGHAVEVNVALDIFQDSNSQPVPQTMESGVDGDLFWGNRAFTQDVDIATSAAAAMRVTGAPTQSLRDNHRSVHLEPGKTVTVVLTMASNFDSDHHLNRAKQLARDFNAKQTRAAHEAWWANYWAKSYVEIGDSAIEKHYYQSLYTMGAASRNLRFPPGIMGPWLTTQKHLFAAGAYHQNYNFVAPFHALYSANRVEQGDPQDGPLLAFRERGAWYAKHVANARGVLFPISMGPLGTETYLGHVYKTPASNEKGGCFHQQRSNALYALINTAQRWRCTYEPAYGRRVYPLVRDVATFWEDYLVWEPAKNGAAGEGRYVDYRDAIHENSGWDTNPVLSLAFIRNTLDLVLDLSRSLDVDADRRAKWEHILTHLSGLPTHARGGKTVFRYSEVGTAWWAGCALGFKPIYPGNTIGLDSPPELLEVARNTFAALPRWTDGCDTSTVFPTAVRLGLDPQQTLARLRQYAAHTYSNGFQAGNPHGIENTSTTPNTINEMLCMSHVSVGQVYINAKTPADQSYKLRLPELIRLFPVWPRERDARFRNIRCWGAFLVSGELKDRQVRYVHIQSERGRDCIMVNPWPGKDVQLFRDGKPAQVLKGERFTFKTAVDETLLLGPVGVKAADLIEAMLPTAARAKVCLDEVPLALSNWFQGGGMVTMQAAPSSQLFYTVDGTRPTRDSTRYREPLPLAKPCVLWVLTLQPEHQGDFAQYTFLGAERGGKLINTLDSDLDLARLKLSNVYDREPPQRFDNPSTGSRAVLPGKRGVLILLAADRKTPAVIERLVEVPAADATPKLRITTSSIPNYFYVMQAGISVDGADTEWMKEERISSTADTGWQTFNYDLSKYAGQTVVIKIKAGTGGAWCLNHAFFDEISVVAKQPLDPPKQSK